MRLYLKGHDYKYAVEQMLLTMFPEERPEYPEGKPAGDRMEIRLSCGSRFTTASCVLWRSGLVFRPGSGCHSCRSRRPGGRPGATAAD